MRLTPESSIEALEERFKLGVINHAGMAWNVNTNQERLDNEDWIVNRISHGLVHLSHYQSVLLGAEEDNGDDDGAAIMWLGSMLHEAYVRRKARG